MKKILKTGLFPAALLCLAVSCNQEAETLKEITGSPPEVTPIGPDITQRVQVVNGLLKFETGADFDQMVDILDERDAKWNDELLQYLTPYTTDDLEGLAEPKLDAIADLFEMYEETKGITGDYVYEHFEDELRFKSLRDKLALLEEAFLDQENPDWDNDPSDHFISGTAEQTLFNARGEIMVGGKLYKMFPNGLLYEVTDGDFNTLWAITDQYENELFEADNVEAYNVGVLSGRMGDCRSWVRQPNPREYAPGSKKYIGYGGHRSFIFSNRVFSTVKHYKKKGRKWKKRRAHLVTYAWGHHAKADPGNLTATCRNQVPFKSIKKRQFRKKLTTRYETMGIGLGKIMDEKVHCLHMANGHGSIFTVRF